MKYAIATIAILLIVGGGAYMYFGREPQTKPLPEVKGSTAAIPDLIAALKGENASDRIAAISAIGYVGRNLDPNPFDKAPSAGDANAVAAWEKRQADQREQKQRISNLLAGATDPLLKLVSDPDAAVRRDAIWAVGAIRGDAAATGPVLTSVLADDKQPSIIRQTSLVALSRIDAPAALAAITALIDDPGTDPGLISAAAYTLRTLGADGVPLLQRLLRDSDPGRRGMALNALSSLRGVASPAAADIASALTADQPVPFQRAAIRALTVLAPEDTVTFERIVATPEIDRETCGIAGEALAKRPGAVAFDNSRCRDHQASTVATSMPEAERRALIAASGGPADLIVGASATGHMIGDSYGNAAEYVVVACLQKKDVADAVHELARKDDAPAPPPQELRIAAVRVANGVVLDSTGGAIDIDTPSGACGDIQVDIVSDITRWPAARVTFTSVSAANGAATMVGWSGQLDPATRLWSWRLPSSLTYLRPDATVFSDILFPVVSDTRQVTIVGRFSGIEAPVTASMPPVAVRYAPTVSAASGIGANRMIIPAAPLSRASWTRVVMYPMDVRGGGPLRSKPVIPEGVPIVTLVGAVILPPEPTDPQQKVSYWRKHLRHEHLAVRMHAAGVLAQAKDRESLPEMVQILNTQSDYATQAVPVIAAYGADVVPLVEPLLSDKRPRVRAAAWAVLGGVGAPAVPQVRKALESGPDEVRTVALKTLKDIRPPQAHAVLPALLPLLDHCGEPAALSGCFDLMDALRASGPAASAAQPALERLLGQTKGYLRVTIASTLRAVGGRDPAIAALQEIARTDTQGDAENALRVLVPEIPNDGLAIFIEVLQRRDAVPASTFAAQQIGGLTPEPTAAFPAVVALARDPDPVVRRRVLPAFRAFRSTEATAVLGALMKDPDSTVRRDVFNLLKDRGLDAAPFMAPLFDETGNPLRHDLTRYLGALGPAVATSAPAIVARLQRLARDDQDPSLKRNAEYALERIRGQK